MTFKEFLLESGVPRFKPGDIVLLNPVPPSILRNLPVHRFPPNTQFKIIDKVSNYSLYRIQLADPKLLAKWGGERIYKTYSYYMRKLGEPIKPFKDRLIKVLKGNCKCLACGREFNLKHPDRLHRDHCPYCLCSAHVDSKRAGSRDAMCFFPEGSRIPSILEPIGKNNVKGFTNIVYRCRKCGSVANNIAASDDNRELIDQLPIVPTVIKGQTL